MSNPSDKIHAAMDDQACYWIARLRSDVASEQDREEFALWLAANPAHRASMDAMLDLWQDLEVLSYRPAEKSVSRRRWLGTGIALAASVLVAMLLSPSLGLGPDTQQYRTELGEQLSVQLPDGSTLLLNTDTSLKVNYREDERQVVLAKGEAFFEVASDAERPFRVTAGYTEVQALGTAFNVLLKGVRSEVTVTEGVVRITELDAPSTRPAQVEVLHENQRLAGERGRLQTLPMADTDNLLAWRDGRLVAEDMPLAVLVEELSRYHPTEIFIAEPGLADTRISGVFVLKDLDSILLALEHTVGVRSVALEDGSVQLIRAPL